MRWFHKVGIEILLATGVLNALILYNDHRREIQQPSVQVAAFRESLVEGLLKYGQSGPCDGLTKPGATTHYLRETEEREEGKRADRQKRRYCMDCYKASVEKFGREVAKKKAKRVTTECAACPGKPRLCFECFPKMHCI